MVKYANVIGHGNYKTTDIYLEVVKEDKYYWWTKPNVTHGITPSNTTKIEPSKGLVCWLKSTGKRRWPTYESDEAYYKIKSVNENMAEETI